MTTTTTGPWKNTQHLPLSQRASVFTDEITLDFADACATAAGAGLRCVDIRKLWEPSRAAGATATSGTALFSHEVPRERWSDMKQILSDHNLQIGAIQSNFGKCAITGADYDAHIAFFPVLVEQAHFFGADVVRVFPFWNAEKLRYDPPLPGGVRPNLEPMLGEIVKRFRPAAELARKENVWLGFEPEHSTYSGSPQEVARIVQAIDNPHVGAAWDVNNGWDDCTAAEAYDLFKGRIYNVHIKERTISPDEQRAIRPVLGAEPSGPRFDSPERSAGSSTVSTARAPAQDAAARLRHQPTLLGTGALPWIDIMRTLERDGYRGLYSIETHFGIRGAYGWDKLKAATTYFMFALRELLEAAERPAESA